MIAVLLAIFGAEVADIQSIVLFKADGCHDSNQENGNADEYAFGLTFHSEIFFGINRILTYNYHIIIRLIFS